MEERQDLISRQAAIDALDGGKMIMMSIIDLLPENVKDEEAKIRIETICGTINIAKQTLWKLPSAQPEHACVGCKHYGIWENEVEYGYPSPCTGCKRRANDNYEQ